MGAKFLKLPFIVKGLAVLFELVLKTLIASDQKCKICHNLSLSHCHNSITIELHLVDKNNLLGEVSDILDNDETQWPGNHLRHLLLFGGSTFNEIAIKVILDTTVSFMILTNRFK